MSDRNIISLNKSPDILWQRTSVVSSPKLFPMQCINPIFASRSVILNSWPCFFSIPKAHKCTQCNFSTGTVAHEISQNTHWRESKQMQRVQLFCNNIIRHMLTHSGEKPHKCTDTLQTPLFYRMEILDNPITEKWRFLGGVYCPDGVWACLADDWGG